MSTTLQKARLPILAAIAFLLMLPPSLAAQLPVESDPGSAIRTRQDLENLAQQYQQVLESPAYSNAVKELVRSRAERISQRLTRGDFELGDRVVLYVEGEPQLPDTVAVQAGPRITLPLFGDISLYGVLRSELEPHLADALSQFIRNPTVRAQALMRISIQGSVGRPGFYVVPADMLLSETLMVAGGPAQQADLPEIRVERGTQVVMEGVELQEALRQGFTLDQLNLQAGDQVVVPQEGGGFFTNIGVIVGVLSSLTFIVIQLAG